MSILIKGMEMPKDCRSCRFCFGYICLALKGGDGDCPLVPVPVRGRLIDADALAVHKFVCVEHDISNADGGACYRRGWNDAVDAIMVNAPAVIEEEEGET